MDAIRKGGRAVLCEGNLDVIMLHQYGFDDALACLGTALTENHVRRLARMADTVTMIFDGDDAGRRAMRRALELFLPQDVQPRCVVMPAGDDPDSFVRREGAEPMAALLGGAPTLVEFAVNDAFGREAADNEGRAKAVNDLVPVLRRIGDPVLRDLWIKTVAERARVGEPALRKRITERQRARPEANEPVRRASAGDERDAEKELVRLLLNHPRLAHHFVEERLGEFVTNPALRRLAERIADRALDSQDKTDYAPAQLLGELSGSVAAGRGRGMGDRRRRHRRARRAPGVR
ncbi:MAG: toprim domain-containing protein [Deltaproteobacteria bacterium]|nr:toprim domain-containing protein [Deltaproteobacteria bacterium]